MFEDYYNYITTYFKIMSHTWQDKDILSWCQKCECLKLCLSCSVQVSFENSFHGKKCTAPSELAF